MNEIQKPVKLDEFKKDIIEVNESVLVYFSTKACNVCKVLRPKIEELLKDEFPKMIFHYVDCEDEMEIAAQYSVFAVPSILVFFDGRESIRKSRNIGMNQLAQEIERIYNMIYG